MNRSRWREIDEPFARALELSGAERSSYLNGLKAGDAELYRAVTELIASTDEAEAVLGERVTSFAGPLLADLTHEDWGDMMPAAKAPPSARPSPLPEPREDRSPLVVAFSVVVLLLLIAAAITLWSPSRKVVVAPTVDSASISLPAAAAPDPLPPQVTPADTPGAAVPTVQPSNLPTLQPSNPPTIQPSTPPPLQPSNPPTLQQGRAYRRTGRTADAERTFRQVLASRTAAANNTGTLEVAEAEWELGDLLRAARRYDEAGRLLRSSLATRQRLAASPSTDVARTLAALALLECEQGRTAASDSLRAQAALLYGRLPAVEGDSSTPLETAVARCR